MKKITTILSFIFALAFVWGLGVFAFRAPSPALAQMMLSCISGSNSSGSEVHGWMWSSTIGYGSLNCEDLLLIGINANQYGVVENAQGFWSGQAWFSTVGWLNFGGLNCASFNISGNDSTNPAVQYPCNVRRQQSGEIRGWARFTGSPTTPNTGGTTATIAQGSCQGANPLDTTQAGCWDGLVSFSSKNDSNFVLAGVQQHAMNYGTYESTVPNSQNQKLLSGFAWGSSVTGWLGFCNQNVTLMSNGSTSGTTTGVEAESPIKLGGQVIEVLQNPFASNLDFSAYCNSYVEGSPAVPPNQNSVDFWDYGPYCPATYSTAELDWNLNGPVGATCTLYFGQGNGTPVMQNITGDGVYVPQLPGGAGYYHMECTNADGPFSASYTITALQSTDQACTSNPTGTPTGTGQTTVGSNTPNYSVSSNDSGLCFNSSTSVVSWVASAVNGGSFDSCRVLDSNQQIVASGLPTHGTNGPTQPYVYDVPGVGAYTVECQKTGTSGTNASDWVVSANTHTFQACQNNFAFNTSAVALCPGSTATLSWNVGTAVTCTTNSTFTTNQLPPLTQSGSKNGVGPGTYELSCDYSNPNETLYDSITITQLSASQCVLPPTGSGTGPGTTTVGKPGVQEF